MSSSTGSQQIASLAVFGPQSKSPGETYLCEVRSFLVGKKYIASLIEQILSLQDVWAILANERDDIAKLSQGPRYLRNLAEWISTGNSSKVSNCMSSIISLPLLTIIQICQYLQYLDLSGKCHSQFLQEVQAGGGIQGYCGGFLPAIAIACSKDEAEVVENTAIAMRVALAIGAYAELGDDESIPGATTIVCRLKKVGQGEELVARFPGVRFFPTSCMQIIDTYSTVVYIRHYRSEDNQHRRTSFSPSQSPSLCPGTGLSRAGNAHSGQSP